MKKTGFFLAALLSLAPLCAAQRTIPLPAINLRYSAQISNAPAGTCGCFALQGGAIDAAWKLFRLGSKGPALGFVADVDAVHTATVSNAPYGLTLSTFTFGPRVTVPVHKKVRAFGQVLFGVAHGSGSQFPEGNSLVPSANSFALNLGAGADYSLNRLISIRPLQLEYLRTQLPNTTSGWQSSLRLGAGITFHLSARAE